MKFLCEQCKAKYQIADDKVAGKTVRMKCRKCGHLIEVRAAVTETSAAVAPQAATPPPAPTAPASPAARVAPPRSAALATSLASNRALTAPGRPPPPGALEGAFKATVQRDEEGSAPFDMSDLSPSDEWYVAINGVPVGPIRIAEVRRKAALGAVTDDSLVWQEGLDEWRPLRSFPELAASVREAISSARASRPPPVEGRTSMPPMAPPSRGFTRPLPSVAPAAPASRVAPPPRTAAPAPPPVAAAARSNVVPIMSRLATAEKLEEEPALSRSSAPPSAPVAEPKPLVPSVAPDPFAVPASAAVPVAPIAAPLASTPPPARKTGLGAMVAVAAAIAFGATAAVTIVWRIMAPGASNSNPTQAVTPAPSSSAASPPTASAVTLAPAPTAADPAAAPVPVAPAIAAPVKPRAGWSPKAAPAPVPAAEPPGNGRTLDVHGLTQNTPTVTPSDDPAVDSPKAAGPCLTNSQIVQVLNQHQPGIRRSCWERNPTTRPSVNVEVTLTVAQDGSAQAVSATGDEPSVSKCIENDVRGWHFPAMGCSQKVSIPMKFVKQ